MGLSRHYANPPSRLRTADASTRPLALSLALVVMVTTTWSSSAQATPPETTPPETTPTTTSTPAPTGESAATAGASTTAPPAPTVTDSSSPADPATEYVTATELPSSSPTGGSVAGPVISADDADARRATGELEGARLEAPADTTLPERASPLARAGWGSLVGGTSLLVAAGIMSGYAEREEDRAARLAALIDLETGKQPLYRDAEDDYTDHIQRGETFARTAQILAITGGVALVTSVVLLLVDQRRGGAAKWSMRPAGPTGLELRF